MEQLTNEEKEKVFAMYWGCECLCYKTMQLQHTGNLIGFHNGDLFLTNKGIVPYRVCEMAFTSLKVTPLSSITDEDALEVAKMAGYDDCKGRSFDVYFAQGLYRRWIDLDEQLVIDDCYSTDYKEELPLNNSWQILQYLISKGYDVPQWFGVGHWANGKTAIELGIAIDKTT